MNADHRKLLAFWDRLRGERDCPDESDLDRTERSFAAEHLFHVERMDNGSLAMRAMGTALAGSLGYRSGPASLLDFLASRSWWDMNALMNEVLEAPAIGYARLAERGSTEEAWEISLLPVRGANGEVSSAIGVLAPLSALSISASNLVLLEDTAETAFIDWPVRRSVGERGASHHMDLADRMPPRRPHGLRLVPGGMPGGTSPIERPRPALRLVVSD